MDTKFCFFVTACCSHRLEHRNDHNYKITNELYRILSKEEADLSVEICCSNKNEHDDLHYLIVQVKPHLMKKCLETTHTKNVNLETVLPSENARIHELSLRMISLSDQDIAFLKSLCQCQYNNCRFDLQARTPCEGTSGSLVEFVNQGLFTLSSLGIISNPLIQHEKREKKKVWYESTKPISLYPSISEIRNYFGNNIGYYFLMLRTYCIMLLLLGSGSFFFYNLSLIQKSIFGEHDYGDPEIVDIHGKPLKPLSLPRIVYGILTIFWSILLIKIWRREKCSVDFKWSHDSIEEDANIRFIFSSYHTRPEYYGTWRISNIDQKLELHYNTRFRRFRYLISSAIIIVCLVFALLVHISLMNLEGFILSHRSPWLYISILSAWAEEGQVFDPNGDGYLAYLPGIIHPILIFIMNQIIFRRIAEWLTDFENHETKEYYDNALIIKRFLFEAIDGYGCLFYLGVVLVDWNSLQSMLNMMFATDTIRRITLEVIVPYFSYKLRSMKKGREGAREKKDDDQRAASSDKRILYADVYEPFDDYLELVLQQGYLVLFATACPPFVAIGACVCAWIESFSDLFKLCFVVQRPMPSKLPHGYGIYTTLFHIQSWIALTSNVLLLYARGAINYETMFLLEHALVIIGLGVHFTIQDEPSIIRDLKRRDIFAKMKQFKLY